MDKKYIEEQVREQMKKLLESQNQVGDNIKVTTTIDTEDERLAREVLEEDENDIRVQIEYRVPQPVEHITISFNVDCDDD